MVFSENITINIKIGTKLIYINLNILIHICIGTPIHEFVHSAFPGDLDEVIGRIKCSQLL